MALLQVEGLRYRWPGSDRVVLDIPHWALQAREAVFLRGPSGCGKSTLLSLLAGVLVADEGAVVLLERDWRALSSAQRDRWRADHIGYVFQQFNLLPYLSVLDNVELPARFSRQRVSPGQSPREEAQHWLAQLSLPRELWSRPAAQLSVGQQQRVACARALMGRPALVIADEPTSALDEALRDRFMHLLRHACEQAGSALVLVSHDARLASHFERHLDLPTLNRAPSGMGVEGAMP